MLHSVHINVNSMTGNNYNVLIVDLLKDAFKLVHLSFEMLTEAHLSCYFSGRRYRMNQTRVIKSKSTVVNNKLQQLRD